MTGSTLFACLIMLMFVCSRTQGFVEPKEEGPKRLQIAMPKTVEQDSKEQDVRLLQEGDGEKSAECYSSLDDGKPNRYCVFDDTPREDTFLVLSCPDTKDDLFRCACTIGVGDPEDAPSTDTCQTCAICKDETLAYDCRNVAEGSCIGRNCRGECISSFLPVPDDLLASDGRGGTNVPRFPLGLLVALWWVVR